MAHEGTGSIVATLDPDLAAARLWDVIVIGAGPAGATAARESARSGLATLLVERSPFPRAKACGGCLNHHAVALIRRAGLGDDLDGCGGRRLGFVELHHRGRRARIAMPPGLAVSRWTLDAMLVRAALQAGAHFLPETTARLAVRDRSRPDARPVELRPRGQPPATALARVIVKADGLGRTSVPGAAEFDVSVAPRARIGVAGVAIADAAAFPAEAITMAIGRAGYAGAVGVEGNRVTIAAAIDPAFVRAAGTPALAVAAVMAEAGVDPVVHLDAIDWMGTVPLTRRVTRPAGWRVIVMGDAAGYVEPFTGEGMAWAIGSAIAAGPIVRRGVADWSDEVERAWLSTHRAGVRRPQRACRRLTLALRSTLAVQAGVRVLGSWPSLARPVVSGLGASFGLGSAAATGDGT